MERVVVVGGGVLGTMHAVAARRRGLDVVHLEREPGPRGASVRNFGLIWVSGRGGGPELSLALRARAALGGAGRRGAGPRVPAARVADAGRRRGRAAAAEGGGRAARRRGRGVTSSRRGRGPRGQPGAARRVRRGAALPPGRRSSNRARCPAGDPRAPAGRARAGPAATAGGPAARRSRSRRTRCATTPATWHRGDLVVLCTGAAHTGLAGPHLAGYRRPPVRRVRLQMMQTRAVRRPADHLGGRRRLAALLPGLRPARPRPAAAAGPGRRARHGPSCCWCSGWTAA